LVVLASGSGTTLQALLDAADDVSYPAQVVAVGMDRPGTGAQLRAVAAGVPSFVLDPAEFGNRASWSERLAALVAGFGPDLVVCAGLMRILDPVFLDRFPDRVINTHPALLPAFPGAHAVRDALAYGVTVTGCTVHFVDAGVDTGPVVAQAAVAVRPDDDVSRLHDRIKTEERQLLVSTVSRLVRQGWRVSDRRVSIP
jgi:formyltetrahydrofolate-dependent phosphoribosylglycinamide formyltransferase